MPESTCACGAPVPVKPPSQRGPSRRYCLECKPKRERRAARSDDGANASRVTCARCGCALTGSQRRWCSVDCKQIVSGQRAEPRAPRTCPVCSTIFTPNTTNQVYCTGYRGRCSRRATNVAQRGGDLTALLRPMPTQFDCAQCGKSCTRGENVAAHASRFCGKSCKQEWHHIQEGQLGKTALAEHRATLRFDEWVDRLLTEPTRMQATSYKRALRADPCAYCSTTPSGIDHIVPTAGGGPDDWTNWAGCCKRCNGYKGALPLLLALPFVPVATEYHAQRRRLFAA